MNERDLDISVTAFLKSIIESGAKPEDWDRLTRQAFNTHRRIVTDIRTKIRQRSALPQGSNGQAR